MKTKHLIKFLGTAAHLDADLEFVDVIQIAVDRGNLKTDQSKFIFDYVKETHSKLSIRANSHHSRNTAASHLKNSIRAAFIKSIYEAASTYFQDILKAAMRKGINTERLLGKHSRNFSCKELIEIGSYPKLLETIAASIFRQLENEKSTKTLIEEMKNKLDLNIPDELISKALPYFEIRHRIVHAEGIADKEFCSRFPNIIAIPNKTIRLSYEIVSEAKHSISNLILEFDKQITSNGIVASSEYNPNSIKRKTSPASRRTSIQG